MSVFVVTKPTVPGENTIQPAADNVEALILKGHSTTQTADLLQYEDGDGTLWGVMSGDNPFWGVGNDPDMASLEQQMRANADGECLVASGFGGSASGFASVGVVNPGSKEGIALSSGYTRNAAAATQIVQCFAWIGRQTQTDGGVVSGASLTLFDNGFTPVLKYDMDAKSWFIGGDAAGNSPINAVSGGTLKAGFLGATPVVRQTGASAAAIAAIIDPNAKAAIGALQAALAALGLVTSPP